MTGLVGDNAKAQLKSVVERIEHLDGEIKCLQDDKKEIFQEAKSSGFDLKALRTIIRLRKQDANERAEAEQILETYLLALDMI
jgi:uncharacterized protein (UPF0335 family)